MRTLLVVVQVTLKEGSVYDGPDVTDMVQDCLDVGFGNARDSGFEDREEMESVQRIQVLPGFVTQL